VKELQVGLVESNTSSVNGKSVGPSLVVDRADYERAVAQLTAAAAAYYEAGETTMTDADYDAGVAAVAAAEAAHPGWVSSGGLLTQVAAGVVSGDVSHSRPMLSLDKVVVETGELAQWWQRVAGLTNGLASGAVVEPRARRRGRRRPVP